MTSISELTQQLRIEFGLTPFMAAEIECYVLLADESAQSMEMFWAPVQKAFEHEGLNIIRIEKERGLHQYEVITGITETPEALARTLARVRAIIEKYAVRMNLATRFGGKPFSDQPSSGLHVHMHMADDQGINSYHKTDEWTSDTLRWSLGGMLQAMATDMPIFFPTMEDYARLGDVDHVPKIFGWGVNNRYCALRIPAYPDPYDKRIEHRLACANADPDAVIAAILQATLNGLRQQIEPSAQQHGKHAGITIRDLLAQQAPQKKTVAA